MIWNIPHRLDVQLFHFLYAHISFVITTTKIVKWMMKWYLPCVILKQVYLFFATCTSYILEELTVSVFFESIVNLFDSNDFVTDTNCCCHCLAGLVSGAILDPDVFSLLRPSLHLESSASENAFITKNEMAFSIKNFLHLVIEYHYLLLELFVPSFQTIWNVGNNHSFSP